MTHTPGPWKVEIDKTGGNWRYEIRTVKPHNPAGEIGKHIATVNAHIQCLHNNADLIAAAPELLEALSDLENYSELVLSEIDSSQSGWYYQFQAAIQKARKALSLAKEGV